VLAVLGAHVGQFVLPGHRAWPLRGGFLGVDVFLVLSGFLITSLLVAELDRTGRVRLRRFYSRRASRLLLALLVLLAVHWCYMLAIGGGTASERRATLFAVTFTSNWQATFGFQAPVEIPIDLLHLWTLALEGQFYLLWGAALWLLARRRPSARVAVAMLLAALLAVGFIRAAEFDAWGTWSLVYTRLDARLDSLLAGALLAVLWSRGLVPSGATRTWAGRVGLGVLAAALVLAEPGSRFLYVGGFTLVAVAAAAVLLAILDGGGRFARALSWRPLRAVGLASFSVYLWHLPVFVWAIRVVPEPGVPRLAFALSVTAALSTASFLLVERPVMRRRGRV
jgi:peptidoglycan/LPS O-acetylase OafA/YrhL